MAGGAAVRGTARVAVPELRVTRMLAEPASRVAVYGPADGLKQTRDKRGGRAQWLAGIRSQVTRIRRQVTVTVSLIEVMGLS